MGVKMNLSVPDVRIFDGRIIYATGQSKLPSRTAEVNNIVTEPGKHDRKNQKERVNARCLTRESAKPSEERSVESRSCDCLDPQENHRSVPK